MLCHFCQQIPSGFRGNRPCSNILCINNTVLFLSVSRGTVEMVWWIRWNWESRWWAVSLSQLVTQLPEGKPVRDWRKRGLLWFWRTVTRCFSQLSTGGVSLSEVAMVDDSGSENDFRLLVRGRIKENLLIDRHSSELEQGSDFMINQGGSLRNDTS